MRGDLLASWAPTGPVGADERRRWAVAARRIATGVAELAHLDPFVDATHFGVGFVCDGDAALAAAYEDAIRRENVDARRVARTGPPGGDVRLPADAIALPCRPDATDDEIRHAVLATMKASHALQFGGAHENAVGADD